MRFWRGVVRNSTSGGNPFAEPANLASNINGGLGVWTGYGTKYYILPDTKRRRTNHRRIHPRNMGYFLTNIQNNYFIFVKNFTDEQRN